MSKLADNFDALRNTGAAFLIADLEIAMTMLQRASQTHDPETRARTLKNAVHAHDTVLRLAGKLDLDQQQRHAVDSLLNTLASALSEFETPPAG
jgi:thioredoxin-like negative regulator of GroEL